MAGGGPKRSKKANQSSPKGAPGKERRTGTWKAPRRELAEEDWSQGRLNNRSERHSSGGDRERRGEHHTPQPPPLNLLPQTELLPSENRMRTANKRNREEAEEDTAEMGEESEYEEAEERSPARKK